MKLFSWIAAVALVLAAVFFLRYSMDRGWLGPPVRMAIGLVVGAGLLAVCELRAARRYPVTANALDASGIAILFATLFAAHALWNLVGRVPTFASMTLVTAVAVGLSIRRDSLFIALLGLVGGFSTPALLSTGEDRPISLFGYLLLLNAGLAWVGYRKRWSVLVALSVGFTALYQWYWVLRFLDAARLPLAISIFLVFPILHVLALASSARRRDGEPFAPLFGQASAASAALPVLFAVYSVSVPAYGERYGLLFGFLLLVATALSTVAAVLGPALLHPLGGVAVVLSFALWFAQSYGSFAWPGVLGFIAVFVIFYLAAPFVARRLGRPFGEEAAPGSFAAPLLFFAFPVLAAIEPATASPGALFATLFVLLVAVAAAAIANEDGLLHYLAAFFALAAEGVWSSRHLGPERLLPALGIYAVFGLFYLGVPLVAERLGKKLEPAGTSGILLLLAIALLLFLAVGPVAKAALWGIGILLFILNAGLLMDASRGRLPILAVVGALLSWFVIGVWWAATLAAALLLPALLVVGGFATLLVAGNLWAERRAVTSGGTEAASPLRMGSFLALVAHLFLVVVAINPALSIPPWPLLGILGVLDLAIGAAALATRKADLHVGALVASQLVLIAWVSTARIAPWTVVALASSSALATFAFLWILLSRRLEITGHGFVQAAIATLFLSEAVAIAAAMQAEPPALIWLVAYHVVILVAILALAAEAGWHDLAVAAVVPTLMATALWVQGHAGPESWTGGLAFAAAIYAVFLTYPLALARNAPRAREPYLAAVLASVSFFFVARHAILAGGFGNVIGVLPIAQAGLLSILIRRLLTLEPPDRRDMGRLALVAGASLAFVTVAIPLQLDREWITIGWALEVAALAWLYTKVPHRGLLAWTGGLALIVFVRLCLNPAVFEYHPRGSAPIWNWYLYTYVIPAAALYTAARWLRATADSISVLLGAEPRSFRVSDFFAAGATILLFLILNIEIADFYSTGPTLTFHFSADLAQDLTYTIGWAVFSIALLAAGIVAASRVPRVAALALLVATVFKCFLHDLWRLGGLYRVASFVGLAVCLSLVAVLLQRFVLGAQTEKA